MSTEEEVRAFGHRWATAEQNADIATLDSLSVDDFTMVGPVGFVLDKQRWLNRYGDGALVTRSLNWDEVTVRDYGGFAIAIGVHDQRATMAGNNVDGQFRATHVLVRRDGRWLLAGMHISPVGQPPRFLSQAQPVGTPAATPAGPELNHTIVNAKDKAASAKFLADILGVPVGEPVGPFVPVRLANGVMLDYDDRWAVVSQHYAFLVTEDDFAAAFARIKETGLPYWADPGHRQAGEINHGQGGRGLYFEDPNGHNMELLTRSL